MANSRHSLLACEDRRTGILCTHCGGNQSAIKVAIEIEFEHVVDQSGEAWEYRAYSRPELRIRCDELPELTFRTAALTCPSASERSPKLLWQQQQDVCGRNG